MNTKEMMWMSLMSFGITIGTFLGVGLYHSAGSVAWYMVPVSIISFALYGIVAYKGQSGKTMKHCDDYIDDPNTPECLVEYLRINRMPAIEKYKHAAPKCFATWEGRRVRIVMASRFGDVGITADLNSEYGYDNRVALADLSDFSA